MILLIETDNGVEGHKITRTSDIDEILHDMTMKNGTYY